MDLSKFSNDLRPAAPSTLELKASQDGTFRGYASTFDNEPDAYGDIIAIGAYRKSLADHSAAGTAPVMLWGHDTRLPIGKWTKLSEDSRGLYVEGQLAVGTESGQEAYQHLKAGSVNGLSVGAVIPKGGREYLGKGTWRITEADLLEISVVALPANRHARITGTKMLKSRQEAIDLLRNCGLSKRAAERFAAGGFSALSHDFDHQAAADLAQKIDSAINQMRKS